MSTTETFVKGVMDELGFQNKEEHSRTKERAGYFITGEEFTKAQKRQTPWCVLLGDGVLPGQEVSCRGWFSSRVEHNESCREEEIDFIV